MITDHLVTAASRTMEERSKIRLIIEELLGGFKDTAADMLENFQEAERSPQKLSERLHTLQH